MAEGRAGKNERDANSARLTDATGNEGPRRSPDWVRWALRGAAFKRSVRAPLLLPLLVKDVIALREPSTRKRWEAVALHTTLAAERWRQWRNVLH